MRSAARSNWLCAMALPDMVGRAMTVTRSSEDASGVGRLEPAARPAGVGVLGLGQGVSRVGHPGTTLAPVGEHADYVGADGAGRLRRVLQHEYQARTLLREPLVQG